MNHNFYWEFATAIVEKHFQDFRQLFGNVIKVINLLRRDKQVYLNTEMGSVAPHRSRGDFFSLKKSGAQFCALRNQLEFIWGRLE